MRTISFTEARVDFEAVIDRVVADRAPLAIRRRGSEGVVLIAQSDWDAMEATISGPLPEQIALRA